MNDLVRSAHRELDEEIHRVTAAYQRATAEAMVEYERGVMNAQLVFEQKLKAAASSMTEALQGAMNI